MTVDDDAADVELMASQAVYYRRRAAEYDATSYGDVAAVRARVDRIVANMRPTGVVLEIACGTGVWTSALAASADTVTAVDVAPETIAIARERVRSANVTFEVADVFTWAPTARFDVIFFSAWLSHVPASRFAAFWRLLRGLLTEGGRVLFVDEHVGERDKETYLRDGGEIVERRLEDGSTYRIVKNFVDPERTEHRLQDLGWESRIRRDDGDWIWVCGEARPLAQAGSDASHPFR